MPASAIRIGINPISWSNDDLPALGGETPLSTALSEGKEIGYEGFELNGKFPKTAQGVADVLRPYDLALVSGLVDRVMVLYSGKIVEEAPVDELYANPTHPYTRGLLASLPRLDGAESRRLPSIAGTPPDPRRRPAGCPFAPRCALKIARCETQMPPLDPVPNSHAAHRAACWVTVEGFKEGVAA